MLEVLGLKVLDVMLDAGGSVRGVVVGGGGVRGVGVGGVRCGDVRCWR